MNIILLLATLTFAQGVRPEVDTFIKTFSYAATNVDLVADSKGNYPHRGELAKTLLALQSASDETFSKAFELLDKNESVRRLVAGDLLLLIAFDLPAKTNWASQDGIQMRNILHPIVVSGKPDRAAEATEWPWVKGADGKWGLGPYAIVPGRWNQSLVYRLGLFRDKYKRRSPSTLNTQDFALGASVYSVPDAGAKTRGSCFASSAESARSAERVQR